MGQVVPLDNVSTERFERVKLGDREARREPEVYLPGLLLQGQSHLFYGASDTGKSWIAQRASKESIHDGKPVLYFDLENGPNAMEERMMDALRLSKEELEGLFYYYPFLDLTLDQDSKLWFTTLLGSFNEPGLVIWDSLLGHLSLCNLSEDKSGDFESWARFYLDQPRAYGWTSIALDHSGHAGTHERGTSRKRQNVQVSFKVEKKDTFDRTKSGRLKSTREKDRLAYLPEHVEVTLGDSPFDLRTKYDGQEFLTNSQYAALHVLYRFGISGATHKEWKDDCESKMSPRTFNRALDYLVEKGYAEQKDKRYYLTKKGERRFRNECIYCHSVFGLGLVPSG